MNTRVVMLSTGLILASFSAGKAQTLTFPIGEWGRSSNHGIDCSPPFLKIEQNRIIKRLEGGEGRCPIKRIKKEGKYLMVSVKCVYDKSIRPEQLIEGDNDDDEFSLIVKSSTKILFNNSPHELCKANSGVAR